MAKRFTLKDVAKSKVANLNTNVLSKEKAISGPLLVFKKLTTMPKSKLELDKLIENWCVENKFEFEKELIFNKIFNTNRRFRFDWAIPELKLGIEYDGIMSKKSRHTTISGFMEDCNKLNIVTANGWSFFRYHTKNYKNFLTDIEQYKKLK
jgi:hypothetical protein